MIKATFSILIVVQMFCTLSCQNNVQHKTISNALVKSDQISYEKASCVEIDTNINRTIVSPDRLTFKLSTGEIKILKDTLVSEEKPEMIKHSYIGLLKNTNFTLFRKTHLTYSQLALININTGQVFDLLEYICINSADKIITYNYSNTDELGLHIIYSIEGDELIKLKELDNQTPLLDSPKWLSNNEIVFKSINEANRYYIYRL